MNVITNIRDGIRQWFLKKALNKVSRRKKILGYGQAQSFGIMYDASSEENYRQITHLVKDLQQDNKKIKTLGYVNLKKMPEYSFPKLTFEFCNAKNFYWDQSPLTQNVKDFIAQDFDALIDLSPSDFFHLKYLAATSTAPFKVGRFNEKYINVFDLMLEVKDDTPNKEAIEHTIFYLKMINNDQPINQ